MRKRSLGNATVIAAVALTAIGLGVAVASAATSPGTATISAGSRPTTSASVTASPSASSSSDGSECADVFRVASPAGKALGSLCTAVTASGTTVSGLTVTLTTSPSCTGSVMLRVSGADSAGAEFGEVKKATCSSGKATASFTSVSTVAPDTFICGTLLADAYTAAQACVPIS